MQLAKIRRKTRVVKKKFHEIWKIAVDLGEFGARRSGRRGAPGRSAARSAVVCGAGAAGYKRGAGAGRRAACGRRGAGVGRRRGSWRWRAGRRGECRARVGRGAAGKTTHLRRTPATNRPELALSAIRTASRMKAMRSGRLCALPPPNSTNRKPNRHRRRPILRILIRFAESQNADRTTLMRVRRKGDRIAARTTIHEGGGDDTRGRGRCTRTIHEGGGDARGRCTRAGAMRGPNTTKRQLEDGTQLQSLWSDRRTRPESPKPRGEGLSPIGTIRFGGV